MNIRLTQRAENGPELIQGDNANLQGAVQGVDLAEYLSILWRQKMLILATIVVIMAGAFLVIASLTPRYTASVLVEINARKSQVFDFEAVLSGLPSNVATLQTEIQIIQSRTIARRAVKRLELNRDPEFNSALRTAGVLATWRHSIAAWLTSRAAEPGDVEAPGADGEEVESSGFFAGLARELAAIASPSNEDSVTEEERVKLETDQVVDSLLQKLSVAPEGQSRVVRISFESTSPKNATAVANTLADFYIVAQLEAKFEATKRATTWLSERVEQLREEVEAKERAIEKFRAETGLLQGGGRATLTSEQVSELNTQRVMERVRLAEVRARLRQVNELLKSPGGVESAGEVLESPLIRDLRREESRVQRQIAELSEEYGERHPKLIAARADLHDLRGKIKIEVDRIIQGLRNKVAVVEARASSLSSSFEIVKREVAQHNQYEVQLRAREREAAASRILLENLLQRTKETASQQNFAQADANIVSYATVPRKASFPIKSTILPLVLIVALAQGVLLAFAIEKLDLGFRSSEQVVRYMGVRSLGLVPYVSKLTAIGKSLPDFILENPESAYGEGIRGLYTNVLLSDVVERPQVILITSALPREGKTSVVLSLGRMLATNGYRIIVVDCDLRRPTVHKEMGIERGPGLTDCLIDGVRVEDVIQEDSLSGAHILQAGTLAHNSPEQLNSDLMQKLLKNLRRKYDLVIMDSPPLLAVSDTLFLSRLADKTIFLIRWARTRRTVASLAFEQLLAARADVPGVLLTMVDVKVHAQYGYGDSGAYHGTLKKYYTG